MSDQSLACDMTVLTHEQRTHHLANGRALAQQLHEHRELSDGYAFRYSAAAWESAAAFVALERLCCPFFDFKLELSHNGDLWLNISGADGAKAVLEGEIEEMIR